MKSLGAAYWLDGAEVAFIAWLGFPAMSMLTGWAFEGRRKELFGIDIVHMLVVFLAMGAILGVLGIEDAPGLLFLISPRPPSLFRP